MYKFILAETRDNIRIITINREDKMNALNSVLIAEIGQEVAKSNKNKTIRGIIITGKGDKAFAAGADIAEFANYTVEEAKEMSLKGHAVFNSIENSSTPVVAAINGFALGGGCELALACHIRIGSEKAQFGQPEVNLGVPPGYGGTQRLAQIIGKGRALDMLIAGKTIGAGTALNYGLITEMINHDFLLNYCLYYLERLNDKSPHAIAEVIKCTNALYDKSDGFAFEVDSFANSFKTHDFIEGTTAFLKKRKPNYN